MSRLSFINALLVIELVLILISPSFSFNYCSKDLCSGKKHCCCGKDGSFGPDCPQNVTVIPMTKDLKCLIVDRHNELRESLCEGKLEGFKPANRMIEMEWDDSLAKNAECTAKTCLYVHDECRSTDKYKDPGQNIALYAVKATKNIEFIKIIEKIIKSWLSQADNVANEIQRYGSNRGDEDADDFAQMIRASCGHIGCAMVYYVDDTHQNVFLVCDYSSANIPNEPIYEIGKACSGCMAGCSSTSSGLCNNEEEDYLLKLNLLNLTHLKIMDPARLGLKINLFDRK